MSYITQMTFCLLVHRTHTCVGTSCREQRPCVSAWECRSNRRNVPHPPLASLSWASSWTQQRKQLGCLMTPLLSDLHEFHSRHKCTKRELLFLIGRLAFAAKVIPAGRMFLRRLIEASTTVTSLHHHLRITKPIRADLDWWLTFASQWNGKAFFLDHDWTPSPAFQLFTDASQLGYGCYWRGHWLYGPWSRQRAARDIQWKELFAILVAATAWASHWRRKRLLVHCDNQAVVDICRTGTSKNTELMRLIRTLFFTAARHNFTLLINHIPGVDNSVADALSRLQFHRFHQLAPEADPEPTPTPVIVISH